LLWQAPILFFVVDGNHFYVFCFQDYLIVFLLDVF